MNTPELEKISILTADDWKTSLNRKKVSVTKIRREIKFRKIIEAIFKIFDYKYWDPVGILKEKNLF